jgi:catechol 2,3-dioxygenase-like lactoylglutathione lyase family enzyme
MGRMPELSGIHHISLTVPDIEKSVAWYSEVLGVQKLMDEQHPDGAGYAIVLGKPDFSLCIGLHTHASNEKERFEETRTGLDHVAFTVQHGELKDWETRLTELGIEHSGIKELGAYSLIVFRDPDNIQLELFCFNG